MALDKWTNISGDAPIPSVNILALHMFIYYVKFENVTIANV